MHGKGFITDVGKFVLPALGSAAGASLAGLATLNPIAGVAGGAFGSYAGEELNNYLKSIGLGNAKQEGKGLIGDILKKGNKYLKDNRILSRVAHDLNMTTAERILRMGGYGYQAGLSQIGTGTGTGVMTISSNGSFQEVMKPSFQVGRGNQSQYGMVSSEFGKVKF